MRAPDENGLHSPAVLAGQLSVKVEQTLAEVKRGGGFLVAGGRSIGGACSEALSRIRSRLICDVAGQLQPFRCTWVDDRGVSSLA